MSERVWTEQTISTAVTMVPEDNQLSFRRFWFHTVHCLHTRLHSLETSWSATSDGKSSAWNCAGYRVPHSSCLHFRTR